MKWLLMSALLLFSAQVFATTSATNLYGLKNPVLQQRFLHLADLLRCPKCQDSSISNSDAEIAADMRDKTAQLLKKGKTDDEIVQFFVTRYGEFVTFKPPLRWDTALVWSAPVIIFLLGLIVVVMQLIKANRRRLNDYTAPEQSKAEE